MKGDAGVGSVAEGVEEGAGGLRVVLEAEILAEKDEER